MASRGEYPSNGGYGPTAFLPMGVPCGIPLSVLVVSRGSSRVSVVQGGAPNGSVARASRSVPCDARGWSPTRVVWDAHPAGRTPSQPVSSLSPSGPSPTGADLGTLPARDGRRRSPRGRRVKGLSKIGLVLALQRGILPPTIKQTTSDSDCDLDYVANTARHEHVEIGVRMAPSSGSRAFGPGMGQGIGF
jgi:hypothetical protein